MAIIQLKRKSSELTDPVQKMVGDFGPWQAWLCFWLSLLKIPVAFHQLGIFFLAAPIDFWCAPPAVLSNLSVEAWKNLSEPAFWEGGELKHDPCNIYQLDYSAMAADDNWSLSVYNATRTTPCLAWEYDRSVFQETISSEWDLVCARSQLSNVAQTTFMLGVLLGNVLFGMWADSAGRKLPLLVSVVMQATFGVATVFVPWFEAFLVLRFIVAVATGGTMITSFVMCMEVVGGPWRIVIAVLYHVPFGLGQSLLSALAYATRDWRYLQVVMSLPSFLFIAYWWLVDESPRWLIAVGRKDDAVAILEQAAARNGRSPSEAVKTIASQVSSCKTQKKGSILDLFRTPNMRKKTLILYFGWAVNGLVFFGLSQYMGQFGGNIFINYAVSGVTGLPGCLVAILVLVKLGRKRPLLTSQLIAGVACLFIMAVPKGVFPFEWPTLLLASAGIGSISLAFTSIYLFSGELFPTVVRNVGVGSASMCARIGSMVAPFVTSLNEQSPYVAPILFGVLPLISAILVFQLPDTHDCELPDSMEDGENFGKKLESRDVEERGTYVRKESLT